VTFEEVTEAAVCEAAANGRPAFRLLELIAVLRVVQEVREVRKEIQTVVKDEACRPKRGRP
jgi:hypothetical protein